MNKETVIQNILVNYGKYGVTRENIERVIDVGRAEGLTYDLIYLTLRAELSKLASEEFFCTSEDIAKAFNVSVDEVNRMIDESREELLAAGENPDDYFRRAEATSFMM